ncbi:Fido domain containing protein [Hyaloscypha variabilis]
MPSPSKPKRMSISSINPLFTPKTGESAGPMHPATTSNFLGSLRQSFHEAWPSWKSIRGHKQSQLINFTITISDRYRFMAKYGGTEGLVKETTDFFQKVCMLQTKMSPQQNEVFYAHLEDAMIEAVFGSNYIEGVGLNADMTLNLCRNVFRGIAVNAEDVPERDPDYAEYLETTRKSKDAVIRERLEVIQHAKAVEFIINCVVHQSQPLSEDIIKKTHVILLEGHQTQDIPHGEYRDYKIKAKYGEKKATEFIHQSAVSTYMKKLCEEYNKDVIEAESRGAIDPVTLAARYCTLFVNIHPFGDGNGRMCRLLMNAILLKYAGICIPIGEGGNEDKDEYLAVATRASKIFYQEDQVVSKEQETSHHELAVVVLKKSRAKLRDLYWALSK